MGKIGNFLKSTGIYFVGNILTKVIAFLLLPLYTKHISADGMGYYDLINSYLNIIVPVICIAIWAGILRFIFDFSDEENCYKVIYNAMLVFFGALVVYTVGVVILGFTTQIKYLPMIYFVGAATMLQNCYSNAARALRYNSIFALSGIIGSLVNCTSNIIMILVFKMEESSLFIALALGLFAQVIVMETKVKMLTHLKPRYFDKEMIAELIKYSAPLAVNSACYWFLSSYNRIGVSNILGLEANGIYAVAGKYTYVIGLVSNCFSMAMQELLYSLGNDKEDKEKTYNITANYYIKALMFGLVLLMPLVYFSFPILIKGESYQQAFGLIPLYLLATVFSIFATYLGDVFAAEKHTGSVFLSTIPAALVNVTLFHLLVGKLGIQAANISLMAGFLVMIIFRIRALGKYYKIRLDYKTIIFTTALFGVSFFVYLKCGAIANAVLFLVCGVLTLVAFRELLKPLISFVRSKLSKKS